MRRSLPYVKRILWTLIDVKNEKMAEIQAKKMPGICRNTLMPRSFVGFRPEVPEAAHRFLVVLLEHPRASRRGEFGRAAPAGDY